MTIVLPDWPAWVYVLVVLPGAFVWGFGAAAGRDAADQLLRRRR